MWERSTTGLIVSVPFGDYLFLNSRAVLLVLSLHCFRPLRGLSIPQYKERIARYGWIVSVPFGDYLFLNCLDGRKRRCRYSFRPLRGLSIPQYWTELLWKRAERVSVPFGDYLFLNSVIALLASLYGMVSVPFGDYLFLNVLSCGCSSCFLSCFRPLRGLSIPQYKKATRKEGSEWCFRPLRGLSIPQSWPMNLSDFLGL